MIKSMTVLDPGPGQCIGNPSCVDYSAMFAFVRPLEPVASAALSLGDQGQGLDAPSSQQIANGSGGLSGRGARDEANLCESVDMGDLDRATELLVKGTNPNLGCSILTPPLAFACSKGHYSMVAKLLEYGAAPFLTKSGKRCSMQTECDRMVLEHLVAKGRCAHCGTTFTITHTRARSKCSTSTCFHNTHDGR